MDCPNCGATMRERDRAGVKIDFCPDCKGVWLDRGELDKIIQIELADTDPAVEVEAGGRRARGDDDDEEFRRSDRRSRESEAPKSKKRSFFESITEMMGGGEGGIDD